MTRATVLQEVRRMRFEELCERRQRRTLAMAEAAERLGMTERTFHRWSGRYEANGVAGLQDRRIGLGSARRAGSFYLDYAANGVDGKLTPIKKPKL